MKIRARVTLPNIITAGKVYEVTGRHQQGDNYFYFTSDSGNQTSAYKHRFDVIEEASPYDHLLDAARYAGASLQKPPDVDPLALKPVTRERCTCCGAEVQSSTWPVTNIWATHAASLAEAQRLCDPCAAEVQTFVNHLKAKHSQHKDDALNWVTEEDL